MSYVGVNLSGRFGNQLFKYAFARAYAEHWGLRLLTTPWIGQEIFQINDPPMEGKMEERDSLLFEQWDGEENVEITGVCQHQKHLIYVKHDAKRWFRFRPAVQKALESIPRPLAAAHLRWGDFLTPDSEFVAISKESYLEAMWKYSVDSTKVEWISEEAPMILEGLPSFLPDFYRLMSANVLFRANSSFSWWAGTLGSHTWVFSPDLRGIPYKQPRFPIATVPFVVGNHMALTSWWEGHSELHIS